METLFVDTGLRSTFVPKNLYVRTSDNTLNQNHTETPGFSAFHDLHTSLFTFVTAEGVPITASLLHRDTDNPNKLLVNFMPFSDGIPLSAPDTMSAMKALASSHQHPNIISSLFRNEFRDKPHSWGPLVRSAVIHNEMQISGPEQAMPVLTIFNPIPGNAFSMDDRNKIWHGDMTPFGLVAYRAITVASERLHGGSGTFNELFFAGQSIGAVRALHAAKFFSDRLEKPRAVVAQEAVVYDEPQILKGLSQLANDYMLHKYATLDHNIVAEGEQAYISVPEDPLRVMQTGLGAEPIGMLSRMIRGMVPRDMVGLTRSGARTTDIMTELAQNKVHVTGANAVDSAVSRYIRDWLVKQTLIPSLRQILISPLHGKKLGHMVNEYATTTGIVIARGASFVRSQ